MKFNIEKFNKWEEDTHIPQITMNMVNYIAERVGCGKIEEETITLRNRGGYVYAYAKGFALTHCTSSMANGPSSDYSDAMAKWLKGLDFRIESSHGDNGMDAKTNWHDTFWTNEFVYCPSIVWEENFIEWEEGDYEE